MHIARTRTDCKFEFFGLCNDLIKINKNHFMKLDILNINTVNVHKIIATFTILEKSVNTGQCRR